MTPQPSPDYRSVHCADSAELPDAGSERRENAPATELMVDEGRCAIFEQRVLDALLIGARAVFSRLRIEVAFVVDTDLSRFRRSTGNLIIATSEQGNLTNGGAVPVSHLSPQSYASTWLVSEPEEWSDELRLTVTLARGAIVQPQRVADILSTAILGDAEMIDCFRDIDLAKRWAARLLPNLPDQRPKGSCVVGVATREGTHEEDPITFFPVFDLAGSPKSPGERLLAYWGAEKLLERDRFSRQHEFLAALADRKAARDYLVAEKAEVTILETPLGSIALITDVSRDTFGHVGSTITVPIRDLSVSVRGEAGGPIDVRGCAVIVRSHPGFVSELLSATKDDDTIPLSIVSGAVSIGRIDADADESLGLNRQNLERGMPSASVDPSTGLGEIRIPAKGGSSADLDTDLARLADILRAAPAGEDLFTDDVDLMLRSQLVTITEELHGAAVRGSLIRFPIERGSEVSFELAIVSRFVDAPADHYRLTVRRAVDDALSVDIDRCSSPLHYVPSAWFIREVDGRRMTHRLCEVPNAE